MSDLATGPMLDILNNTLAKLTTLDAQLWQLFGYGIDPQYTNYGVPEGITGVRAFMLLEAYHEELTRKSKAMKLLVSGSDTADEHGGSGILAAMRLLSDSI